MRTSQARKSGAEALALFGAAEGVHHLVPASHCTGFVVEDRDLSCATVTSSEMALEFFERGRRVGGRLGTLKAEEVNCSVGCI